MGLMDKVKSWFGQHADQADAGIEKAGDAVDDKTDGKYAEQVDKGQDVARDQLGKLSDEGDGQQTP
jgi:hypothetical protein